MKIFKLCWPSKNCKAHVNTSGFLFEILKYYKFIDDIETGYLTQVDEV